MCAKKNKVRRLVFDKAQPAGIISKIAESYNSADNYKCCQNTSQYR